MYYLSEIRGAIEKPEGTYLTVLVPKEKIVNKIVRYKVDDVINIEIRIDDGRTITNDQRKKYFATLNDICDYLGHPADYMDKLFKLKYCLMNGIEKISMKDCSVSQAREMINLILDYAIEEGVPLAELGALRTDDIDRFIYMCIATRKCCVCGKERADLHHALEDKVGMGRDRTKIIHVGLLAITLCREHHNQVDNYDERAFYEKHHIYPIKLDENLVRLLEI